MSLISHLIGQYAPSAENAATEAVAYVLQRSVTARATLSKILSEAAPGLPSSLHFRTQATGLDNALPDIEGVAQGGAIPALIEAKFWAGLTDNQPVGYLKRFSAGTPGVLAFLAPSKRFVTLWPEITGRVIDAGQQIGPTQHLSGEYWHAALASGHHIAIFSWRLLIDTVFTALTAANQHRLAAENRILKSTRSARELNRAEDAPARFRGESAARAIAAGCVALGGAVRCALGNSASRASAPARVSPMWPNTNTALALSTIISDREWPCKLPHIPAPSG